MSTATFIAPGRLHSTPTRQASRTVAVRSRPAPQITDTTAQYGGTWHGISHWLGDAFATWASGGRIA